MAIDDAEKGPGDGNDRRVVLTFTTTNGVSYDSIGQFASHTDKGQKMTYDDDSVSGESHKYILVPVQCLSRR